jgi:hypothetical protein
VSRDTGEKDIARQLANDVAHGERRLDVVELVAIEIEVFLPDRPSACAAEAKMIDIDTYIPDTKALLILT